MELETGKLEVKLLVLNGNVGHLTGRNHTNRLLAVSRINCDGAFAANPDAFWCVIHQYPNANLLRDLPGRNAIRTCKRHTEDTNDKG